MKLNISFEINKALKNCEPVVAIESTVLSHGLPFPTNLETILSMENEVKAQGALPAVIGVVKGIPTIGLSSSELEFFAQSNQVLKISRREIGYAVAMGYNGATTVSATIALSSLAGIDILATGGIGGIHRKAQQTWDISADLLELMRTQVLVVCAGAKAILDIPATLEYLETVGVPVIGFGCNEFPSFYTAKSGLFLNSKVDTAKQAKLVWHSHKKFGGGSGSILAVPPINETLDIQQLNESISKAIEEADQKNITGKYITPFLLQKVSELTKGASLQANISILLQNAKIAAQIACAQ